MLLTFRSFGLHGAGLWLAIALVASACDGDEDSGGGANGAKAGSGGRAQAGNGGRSSAGKAGSSSPAAGRGGKGGSANGGTAGRDGGSAGDDTGDAGTSGDGGADTGSGGVGGTGGTGIAGGASGQGGEGGDLAGASGAGGSPPDAPVCGDNVVEAPEDCDGGNTTNLDACNSKCQIEVSWSSSPGLAIVDEAYNGTLASMQCVDLAVLTKGDGVVDSVSVLAGITHAWVGDLVLKVVSPANTVVTLVSRPGLVEAADDGNGSNTENSNLSGAFPISFRDGGPKSAENIGNTISATQTVCQDDASCAYAPSAGAATAGTLSAFTGQAAAGTWRFCAGDAGVGDAGTLDFVRLSVVQ